MLAAAVEEALDLGAGEIGLFVLDGGEDGFDGDVGTDLGGKAGGVVRVVAEEFGDAGGEDAQFAVATGLVAGGEDEGDVEGDELAFVHEGGDFIFGEIEQALGGGDRAEGALVAGIREAGQGELAGGHRAKQKVESRKQKWGTDEVDFMRLV